jgi:hypothetical protein
MKKAGKLESLQSARFAIGVLNVASLLGCFLFI